MPKVPVERGDVEDGVLRHLPWEVIIRSVQAVIVTFPTVAPVLPAVAARSPPPRLARALGWEER